jgi:hypothetical protein
MAPEKGGYRLSLRLPAERKNEPQNRAAQGQSLASPAVYPSLYLNMQTGLPPTSRRRSVGSLPLSQSGNNPARLKKPPPLPPDRLPARCVILTNGGNRLAAS